MSKRAEHHDVDRRLRRRPGPTLEHPPGRRRASSTAGYPAQGAPRKRRRGKAVSQREHAVREDILGRRRRDHHGPEYVAAARPWDSSCGRAWWGDTRPSTIPCSSSLTISASQLEMRRRDDIPLRYRRNRVGAEEDDGNRREGRCSAAASSRSKTSQPGRSTRSLSRSFRSCSRRCPAVRKPRRRELAQIELGRGARVTHLDARA